MPFPCILCSMSVASSGNIAIHPHMHPSGQQGSHSSIRPSMHLFTHPPLHSSTQLPTQPQSFMQLSAHSPIRPLIPASIHPSSTHSSVHPPLYPSIRAFTQTSIHRSINASIHPKAWPQCTIGLGGTREAITICGKKKPPNSGARGGGAVASGLAPAHTRIWRFSFFL